MRDPLGRFDGFLPSAAALLVYMPADRKASVREFCIIALPPLNCSGFGVWTKRGFDVSLTPGTAHLV